MLRLRCPVVAITALCVLASCNSSGTTSATSSTSPPPTTTTAPAVVYPPTNLRVDGFSPGVNQAAFYPAVHITAVACATSSGSRAVSFALPPGAAGTPARTALTVPTTVTVSAGRAELRDRAGRVLYAFVEGGLTPSDHGSFVLSMTEVTGTDTDGHRVAPGAVNVSGDYLCP